MMQSFTDNYEDESTEAGFQFTFSCDICGDGYKSDFIASETNRKGRGLGSLARGAGVIGGFLGGFLGDVGYSLERGGDVLADNLSQMSPEWRKEHEHAFESAQREAIRHFIRCHGCNRWVCQSCYNEDEGLCTECAPRQEISVARGRAEAMIRNIETAVETATVWQGTLESKTTVCPICGKPSGNGRFCNACGASLDLATCPSCGAKNAQGTRFCSQCGTRL